MSHVACRDACCLVVIAVALCLVMGCTKSGAGGEAETPTSAKAKGRPNPVPNLRSARIVPDPITLLRLVTVEIRTESDDDGLVAFRYQWLVNGHRMAGQTGPTLDSGLLKRGDRVSVEITPAAGDRQGLLVRTAEVLVGNTPPTVRRVQLEPAFAHRGDTLHAVVEAADPDHDTMRYRYRWMRNQKVEQETEEPALETGGFQRGDTIAVEVIASDSFSHGRPAMSDLLVLGNSPPRITSTPSLVIDSTKYQYPVTAVDADGDFLNFTLTQGPPGMHIDRMTGQLQWLKPAVSPTTHRVRLLIDDGHDGQAFQEFDLTVTSSSVQQSAVSDQPKP